MGDEPQTELPLPFPELAGDMPLLRAETLELLVKTHAKEHSAVTLATAVLEDPTGYGRIIRDPYGNLQGIIEESDCKEAQKQVREVNPSYYCFDRKLLFEALDQIKPANVKGEYYITDALQILIQGGHRAVAITAVAAEDAMGVNSRANTGSANQPNPRLASVIPNCVALNAASRFATTRLAIRARRSPLSASG